jgi:hypothetical protein
MKIALVISLTIGCGGSSSTGADANGPDAIPDAPTDPSMRYEPWTVGSTWSYKLTDPRAQIQPRLNAPTTVMAKQDVGGLNAGKMAFLVHIEKLQGSKDVWEAPVGDLDVRYKTTFYDQANALTETDYDQPYRLKLDEGLLHVAAGAHYSETFTETVTKVGMPPTTKSQSDDWTVISANEQVTVIAGTFTCLHVQRNNPAKPGPQDYWYARGVGKIKETGGGQDEELMSYTIAP